MNRFNLFAGFEFEDDRVFNDDVQFISAIEPFSFVYKWVALFDAQKTSCFD